MTPAPADPSPARTSAGDSVEALERAWDRYRERAEAVAKGELDDDVRKKAVAVMVKHAMAVRKLVSALE